MAATVELSESNAGPTVTDGIANINFGSIDLPNIIVAQHKIIRGTSSYLKNLQLHLVSLGGSTQIANPKMWKSVGVYLTGESITTNLQYPIDFGYNFDFVSPTQAPPAGPYSMPVAEPGGANFPCSGTNTGNFSYVMSAPGYSRYVRLQLSTTGSTPLGSVNPKTFTIQYEET